MKRVLSSLAIVLAGSATTASANFAEYYIAVDGLANLTSGTYAGLANPNHNRLSLMVAHTYPDTPASNHYHNKSAHVYVGPLPTPTVQPRPASNWIPEGSTRPPEPLVPGAGPLAGYWVTDGEGWGNTEIRSTASLAVAAAGSPEQVLFASSAGRYTTLPSAANVSLKLLETNGLKVLGPGGAVLLDEAGETTSIGLANASLSWAPYFAVDANAPLGTYSATFQLIDTTGSFGDSGQFVFNAFVPEPTALAGIAVAAVTLLGRRRLA